MSEPKRLIEDGTAFDRSLLLAGRKDRPSRDYERRVIAAAALVPATTVVAQTSFFARLVRPRYLAVLAIGAGAAVLASSSADVPPSRATSADVATPGVVETAARPVEAAPAQVATQGAVEPTPTPARESAEPREAIAVTTPDALPTAPPPPARRANVAASPALAAPSPALAAPSPANAAAQTVAAPAAAAPLAGGAALEREVELLDRVKRGLRAGELPAAERALDAYDIEFASGTLSPEAGFLRIRLLLARGDRARAVALGEALLARHPNSVHAKRIRAALAADVAAPSSAQASPR